MEIQEPIRILSDLHFGHPSCSFQDATQLVPLFQGVSSVIFNGDSVETQLMKRREQGLRNAELLKKTCETAGARPYFINGNHDPEISGMDHADVAGGAVLATHGDMLFHDISPWSKAGGIMGKAHTKALAALDDEAFNDFEKRLHASKRAVLAMEMHDVNLPQGFLARFAFLLYELWPPWMPLKIIKCWIETPGKAVALARVFRPQARFIVIGHTHWSGVWKRGPRVIINTGSFMPCATRYAVDIAGGKLSVKRIERDGPEFVIGKEVAQFDATALTEDEI